MAAEKGTAPQPCPDCPHERRVHSRNGCEERGCPCRTTYMQIGERNRGR